MSGGIEFRAWDGENMIADNDLIIWCGKWYRDFQAFEHFISGDPDCLMQSTGIKDVNGTAIFQGDIVKSKQPYATVHVVTRDTARASFYLRPLDGLGKAAYDKGYKMNAGKKEVIGNIHQNPELLEQRQCVTA